MEQQKNTIEIAPHNCAGCYRCVRSCGVKAIEIRNDHARIIHDECTRCGSCMLSCPHGMVTMRDEVSTVRHMIKNSERVVASLGSTWVTEFPGITPHRMVEALRLLGFSSVSETLLGRQKYDQATLEQLQRNPRVGIATNCPVSLRLIQRHYPEHADKILPIAPPSVLHARMIRTWSGQSTRVVYVTPCVAAKTNSDETSEIDAVITFSELRRWMVDEGVEFDFIPGNESYHFEPAEGCYVAYDMLHNNGIDVISYDGLDRINQVLSGLDNTIRGPLVLELLGCPAGCTQGVGATQDRSILQKQISYLNHYKDKQFCTLTYRLPFVPTTAHYPAKAGVEGDVAESQIVEALALLGKRAPRDMHNCNGCGYDSCRDFARALVRGRVEAEMCLSYSRNLAQKKFTDLLGRMPSGVMLADADLRIVEANRNLARTLGPDAELIFDATPGMAGADLRKLIDFEDRLGRVLETGEEIVEQDVQFRGQLLKVSVFSIEPHRLICVVVSNLLQSDILGDEVINRTRQVIRENLATVQKIAYLLGENASRTEAILNSIAEVSDGNR